MQMVLWEGTHNIICNVTCNLRHCFQMGSLMSVANGSKWLPFKGNGEYSSCCLFLFLINRPLHCPEYNFLLLTTLLALSHINGQRSTSCHSKLFCPEYKCIQHSRILSERERVIFGKLPWLKDESVLKHTSSSSSLMIADTSHIFRPTPQICTKL